jgi:hypothetical protein
MNLVTAVKVGVAAFNNRKKIGKYIAGFIIGLVLLLSIPGILVSSVGNFVTDKINDLGESIVNTFTPGSMDIVNTDSYEVLTKAYDEFKSSFIEKMKDRANAIREENKVWVDTDGDGEGHYEYPVSASVAFQDMQIYKIYAYIALKNSTLTEKKDSYIGTEDEIKEFLDNTFTMTEEWTDSSSVTVFNKIMDDDEILNHYYPGEDDKRDFYYSSKDIFNEIISKSSVPEVSTEKFTIEDIIKIPRFYGENLLSNNQVAPSIGLPARNYEAPKNGGNNKVVYYSQSGNQPWSSMKFGGGTISSSGCSVTCIAMVLSYESSSSILPSDVVQKIASNNNGNYNRFYVSAGQSWDIFPSVARYYGYNCHSLSEKSVKTMLASGHPVIASCKPGEFTQGGHFIVLTGITEDGKVTVNDPNFSHAGKSSKHYDFESISKQFKGYWSMTK